MERKDSNPNREKTKEEICLTSNMKTKYLTLLSYFHFKMFFSLNENLICMLNLVFKPISLARIQN